MNLAFNPARVTAAPLSAALFDQVLHNGADYTRLTNSFSIERKLEEIRRKRLSLTLHVYEGGKTHVFQSSIQAVEPGNDRAILTQLLPSSWRSLVTRKLPVTISCEMPNGHLLFDSTLSPSDKRATSLCCILDIPAEMHKQRQLRTSRRVSMQEHDTRLSLWVNGNKKAFSGKCIDLSLNGCCGEFPDELQHYLAPTAGTDAIAAETHFSLQVALNDAVKFDTTVRVCRSKPEDGGKLTLGIHFVDTDSEAQRLLQRSLSAIEREQLRDPLA